MKIAVVLMADIETHGDAGRFTNAVAVVKELHEAGHEVKLLFDGAGTRWVPELVKEDEKMKRKYAAVKETIAGACRYCAAAFHVREEIERTNVPLLGDYEGYPSLRSYLEEGYQIVTF
jgi:hypothetical protein